MNKTPAYKRIIALIGAMLFLLLAVSTLIAAILGQPGNVVLALLFASMAAPFFAYIAIWIFGLVKKES